LRLRKIKLSNDFNIILKYSFVQNKLQIRITVFLHSNSQAKRRIQFSEDDTSSKERYEKHQTFRFNILTSTRFPCNSEEEQNLPDPQSRQMTQGVRPLNYYVINMRYTIMTFYPQTALQTIVNKHLRRTRQHI
jgi:hypothetical protein